jgi:hypothetical protein
MKNHPYAISRSTSWRKTVIFIQALNRPHRWVRLLNNLWFDKSISARLIEQARACFYAYVKKD